jgi:hypothetical protein
MRVSKAGLALALLPCATAHAGSSPFSIEADLGERIGLDAMFTRAASTFAWRDDRWHVGLRLAIANTGAVWIAEQAVELGVMLHASHRLDVTWFWRAGHAYIHDATAGVTVTVHALTLDTGAALTMPLGREELWIAPLVLGDYRAGSSVITIGPEVGIARRF